MGWDNRLFSVNGRGKEMLAATLAIAAQQHGDRPDTFEGWIDDPKKGLILVWHAEPGKANKFISRLTASQVAEQVWPWLESIKHVKPYTLELLQWEGNMDHDGSNSIGWRVYCEDWGHVGPASSYAIVAVKPVYLWHGK